MNILRAACAASPLLQLIEQRFGGGRRSMRLFQDAIVFALGQHVRRTAAIGVCTAACHFEIQCELSALLLKMWRSRRPAPVALKATLIGFVCPLDDIVARERRSTGM